MSGGRRRLELLKKIADRLFAPLKEGEDQMLFDFTKAAVLEPDWRIITDEDVGGRSRATLLATAEAPEPHGDEDADVGLVPNFARFQGRSSNVLPEAVVHPTGFAAVKSAQLRPPPDLHDFEGLELLVRGDGRTYMLNMEPDTYFSEDLYQHLLRPEKHWTQVMIPFHRFILTAAGKYRDQQRVLEGGPQLKSLGFSIVDGEEGPFQLDIGYIKAVRSFDDYLEELRKTQAKGKDRPSVW